MRSEASGRKWISRVELSSCLMRSQDPRAEVKNLQDLLYWKHETFYFEFILYFVPCNSNSFNAIFQHHAQVWPHCYSNFHQFWAELQEGFHWHSRSAMFAQRHGGIDPKRDKPALVDDYCKADFPGSYRPNERKMPAEYYCNYTDLRLCQIVLRLHIINNYTQLWYFMK